MLSKEQRWEFRAPWLFGRSNPHIELCRLQGQRYILLSAFAAVFCGAWELEEDDEEVVLSCLRSGVKSMYDIYT